LTGVRQPVTPGAQEIYRRTYSEHIRHYLFMDNSSGALSPIGFARIAMRDGFAWPSCGVPSWARGKGYGWEVVKRTLLLAGSDMKGELLLSNKAIQHIDYALGWVNDGPPKGDVQPIKCSWPPPFVKLGQQTQQESFDEIVRYHENLGDGLAAGDRSGCSCDRRSH